MPDYLPENIALSLGEAPGKAVFHLTLVKPGRFLMGSNSEKAYENEQPVHEIRFEEPFYIGTFPVTQAQWEAVFPGRNPSDFKGPNLPVENVSWHDIVDGSQKDGPPEAFLTRINRLLKENIAWAGYAFRLPTEAEWEYAAKGGHLAPQAFDLTSATADLYPEYADGDELGKVGWHRSNSNRNTHPLGRKQANVLGLYDLSGNVEEWCADAYDGKIYRERQERGSTDPAAIKATKDRPNRVLRGGSWIYSAQFCRLSYRNGDDPEYRSINIGFRLVLAPVRAGE
ncbi:MAG: formylglycine-generating enzyme family protein [Lewinella sp.]